MNDYNELVKTVNFANPSWDAFILLFWAVVSIIYSFSAGRGRIISILVSVYMAELVVLQAPFLGKLLGEQFSLQSYLQQLVTFLILFGFFFWVLSKYVFHTAVESTGFTSWIYSVLFSVLQVGFLISVILSFLPPEIKDTFTPLVKFLFITDTAVFVWLLLPIAFLVFVGRFLSHRRLDY